MPDFLSDPPSIGLVRLPCGSRIDLARSRWSGALTQAEVVSCRSAGIALAYDPVQIGWVIAERRTREQYAMDIAARPAVRSTHPSAIQSNLHLRPWRKDDLDAYVALLDDPAVWSHLPEDYPNPLTRDLAEVLIDLSNASNHHEVRAVISDEKPVGQVRILFDVAEALGCAEISYWLGRDHWGKGIASKAVVQYTEQSFDQHPQFKTLFARVHGDNNASARVLEKSGYRHSGPDPDRAGWQVFQRKRQDRTAH